MNSSPEVLYLNTSLVMRRFDRPLQNYLAKQKRVACWEFGLGLDEPSSIETAITLLHEYINRHNQPMHLVGHGINGLLGLLYARQYPDLVKSLTLLAVAVNPAQDWQFQYYVARNLLPYSREMVLAQIVHRLFGCTDRQMLKGLIEILAKDLDTSLSLHSLIKQTYIPAASVPVPLLVCGSRDDLIVDGDALRGWLKYFKEGDRLWECAQGKHFAHYFNPHLVGRQLILFWRTLVDRADASATQSRSLSPEPANTRDTQDLPKSKVDRVDPSSLTSQRSSYMP
jgi:pimeloyl-ACP methyl ester carboxylesterase